MQKKSDAYTTFGIGFRDFPKQINSSAQFIFSLIDLVSAHPLVTLTALGMISVSRIRGVKFLECCFSCRLKVGENVFRTSRGSRFKHQNHRRAIPGMFLNGAGGQRMIQKNSFSFEDVVSMMFFRRRNIRTIEHSVTKVCHHARFL